MTRWILRRNPELVNDRDLQKVHLRFVNDLNPGKGGRATFGVMTIMVFVFTSIHSLLSNVRGSLEIIMIDSLLSALSIRYDPASSVSSKDVPDEKKREEASDVREEMYLGSERFFLLMCKKIDHLVATTVSPSLTT